MDVFPTHLRKLGLKKPCKTEISILLFITCETVFENQTFRSLKIIKNEHYIIALIQPYAAPTKVWH